MASCTMPTTSRFDCGRSHSFCRQGQLRGCSNGASCPQADLAKVTLCSCGELCLFASSVSSTEAWRRRCDLSLEQVVHPYTSLRSTWISSVPRTRLSRTIGPGLDFGLSVCKEQTCRSLHCWRGALEALRGKSTHIWLVRCSRACVRLTAGSHSARTPTNSY